MKAEEVKTGGEVSEDKVVSEAFLWIRVISRIPWLVKVITDAIFIIQQSQQVTCEKCFFFFFLYLLIKEREWEFFIFFFFFHLDPHFYFSKMEKMKIKIWREGESIIVHLITFFLFLLHFIFLSTIKKKKKYTLSTYNYLWIYHYLRGWLTVYAAQALA